MANEKRRTTEFLQCNHCGNRAPMEIVADYYFSLKTPSDDPYPYYGEPYPQVEEGYYYKLLLCLACKEVTLWKYFDADYIETDEIMIETLYPSAALRLSGLPTQIQQAYEIALTPFPPKD